MYTVFCSGFQTGLSWVIVKQETKQAEEKRNETRRDTTKTKQDKAETKKKSSINKKTKQTLTKRFFLHETTIHKMPAAD